MPSVKIKKSFRKRGEKDVRELVGRKNPLVK